MIALEHKLIRPKERRKNNKFCSLNFAPFTTTQGAELRQLPTVSAVAFIYLFFLPLQKFEIKVRSTRPKQHQHYYSY